MKITREQAIKETSIETVLAVESEMVSQTGRQVEGFVEYSAEFEGLKMFLLISDKEYNSVESEDMIDWEAAIEEAEYMLV